MANHGNVSLDSLDRDSSMVWQLQEAKQRFSELVRKALVEGPQIVTRRGEAVVVVVPAQQFHLLSRGQDEFKAFLSSAPDLEPLDIRRGSDVTREVELDG